MVKDPNKTSRLRKVSIILAHAAILWMLCGTSVMIGRSVTTMELTLIIHAIGAPIFAATISFVYFSRFRYTTPLQTASIFVLFTLMVDAGFVAPVLEKSFEMFHSILGMWIPQALIFSSTCTTGILVNRNRKSLERFTG